MAVPADILAVKRPLNTVVVDHGGDGRKRFAVLARKESVHRPGKSSSPRNGKVVGHIIGGKYVPLDSMSLAAQGSVTLSYGVSALLHKLMSGVFRELLDVFSINDALSIMVLIDARIKRPNIPIIEVQEVFRSSYASVYWRGAPVSKNSLYSLITRLGESYYRRLDFCKLHIANLSIKDQLVVLDEAHRKNPTEDPTLADYTLRPQRYDEFEEHDFFTLYAYSAVLGEPVCLDTYLGDYDEITVPGVASLMEKYGLTNALIFNDGQF
ncbi:MAG: hypothetical protein LUC43_01215, partial [Burkholderiales bacterium]|nr:hypothetical protein [Burkholderiales bacterium]